MNQKPTKRRLRTTLLLFLTLNALFLPNLTETVKTEKNQKNAKNQENDKEEYVQYENTGYEKKRREHSMNLGVLKVDLCNKGCVKCLNNRCLMCHNSFLLEGTCTELATSEHKKCQIFVSNPSLKSTSFCSWCRPNYYIKGLFKPQRSGLRETECIPIPHTDSEESKSEKNGENSKIDNECVQSYLDQKTNKIACLVCKGGYYSAEKSKCVKFGAIKGLKETDYENCLWGASFGGKRRCERCEDGYVFKFSTQRCIKTMDPGCAQQEARGNDCRLCNGWNGYHQNGKGKCVKDEEGADSLGLDENGEKGVGGLGEFWEEGADGPDFQTV